VGANSTEFITGGREVDLPARPFRGRMLIDGAWIEAADGERIDRESPAHGVAVSSYPAAKTADVDRAVSAARKAFDHGAWPRLRGAQREAILRRVAEGIVRRKEELALLETLESGKPISQARDEISGCTDLWIYAAALARNLHGDSYNTLGEDMLGLVIKEPIGVVSLITPWNFPLWILSQKLPFALAAGCTAVVKPSEFTSATTLILGEILLEAGVPAGVVNIVTGTGPDCGAPMVSHPQVDMISFTGSTRVGKAAAATAAGALKKVALELGGKNPQIVFPDCDWEAALDAVVFGVYFNAGECCNSGSRLLVHADIAERFTEAVIERARRVPVGEPLNTRTKVGAIINRNQMGIIDKYLSEATSAGAQVRLGGEPISGVAGLFMQPTVLTGVTREMRVAREEIFGPVLSVLTFETAEEAVAIANETLYGLSAAVWSRDFDICLTAARRIKAGTIWINSFMDGYPELPFGGYRESGIGRELGRAAAEDYTETKTVQMHVGPRTGWWLPR
jgi:acyl-CoA reductase-like NAD-dependent aldehyde dehydrogenase